jgi:hypothetical protein
VQERRKARAEIRAEKLRRKYPEAGEESEREQRAGSGGRLEESRQ